MTGHRTDQPGPASETGGSVFTEFPPAARQPKRRMKAKECLSNALLTAVRKPELRYAEGIAKGSLGFWYKHAWNVNADGQAIDYTWKQPGSRYIGRIIGTDTKRDTTLARGTYEFDDPQPFVPEGESGIDCYTRTQTGWLREQMGLPPLESAL